MYRRACEGGSMGGCLKTADRLVEGLGTRKDERRARAMAERACTLEPLACWKLGRFLAYGIGGPADLARAGAMYKKSCDSGDESACARVDSPLPPPDAGVTNADAGPSP
jgi:TPR repeat protein